MAQLTRQQREQQLKQGVLDGSMSRSQALGAADPRHRRGPQREQSVDKRFDPDQFRTDTDDKLRLELVGDVKLVALEVVEDLVDTSGLPTTADAIDALEAKINELLERLRDAGGMKR